MKNIIKTHFVFDLDDTLTDSYSFNQEMFVQTFTPYLDLTQEQTAAYLRRLHFQSRGQSMVLLFSQAITRFSLPISASLLAEKNEQLHIANFSQIQPFPAAIDFVKQLKKQDKHLSICTNRQTESTRLILKKYHLSAYFDQVISCKDKGHEKPDPYCLLELIKKSRQSKQEFIYFGDSPTDFQFADNAGIDSIIIDHYLNQKSFYQIIFQAFL